MMKALDLWDKVMFAGLLLLVIFVPYSSVMIQGGLLIMMLAWLIKHTLICKKDGFRSLGRDLWPGSIMWPIVFLGLLIILTCPFSHAPALTLKKFFSRFVQQVMLMLMVIETVKTPRRLYQVMAVMIWTLSVVCADIVIQYFSGHSFIFHSAMLPGERITGPMRHPNDLGTLLVMVFPIVLALMVTRESWVSEVFGRKYIFLVTVVCSSLLLILFISLGLTFSRGAWLAFSIILLGWGIYTRSYKWTAGISVGLILFLVIFGLRCLELRTDISPRVQETSVQTGSSDVSSMSHLLNPSRRFEYWSTAQKVIERYPLFGCGYNAYIQTLQKLKLEPQEYPHNSLFHIAAEVGFLGLIGYFWLWGMLFFKEINILQKISSSRSLFLVGAGIYFGLVGWWIHSLTDTAWESLPLSFMWWMMAGLFLSLETVFKQSREGKVFPI